jgi:cytoskeletal protein RodZ
MPNNRSIWLIVLSTVLFFGAALVTLRAAEQANRPTAVQASGPAAGAASATRSKPTHPPASAPEESATITDDPTTAPDPSQSADNNVSFPTDI